MEPLLELQMRFCIQSQDSLLSFFDSHHGAKAKYFGASTCAQNNDIVYKFLIEVFGREFSSIPRFTGRKVYFMRLVSFQSCFPSVKGGLADPYAEATVGVSGGASESQRLLEPFAV